MKPGATSLRLSNLILLLQLAYWMITVDQGLIPGIMEIEENNNKITKHY